MVGFNVLLVLLLVVEVAMNIFDAPAYHDRAGGGTAGRGGGGPAGRGGGGPAGRGGAAPGLGGGALFEEPLSRPTTAGGVPRGGAAKLGRLQAFGFSILDPVPLLRYFFGKFL
jgi:hypothetical protein